MTTVTTAPEAEYWLQTGWMEEPGAELGIHKPITIDRKTNLHEHRAYWCVRRAQDIFFSLLALIALSPLMLLTCIAVWIDSPGASPVFSQLRVGRNGKLFRLYKFRSMCPNAESKLNDLESEIMRYIIELRDDIDDVTLKSVAERFFVAPNTIVRLAHKLGFSGFTELKQSYSASLDRNRFTIEALPLDTQLVQTKDLLNDRVIDSVVSLIQDASHIVFFCSGFSKYPCLEMAEKLKIMGKNTDTLSERHVMRHYAELLGKNDLVFSVSVSGETQVSIDATSIAKTRGCKVVTLTGFSRNSLSKLADYPIYTVQKEIRLGSMDLDSRLMFYYVFELIFERYFKLAKK